MTNGLHLPFQVEEAIPCPPLLPLPSSTPIPPEEVPSPIPPETTLAAHCPAVPSDDDPLTESFLSADTSSHHANNTTYVSDETRRTDTSLLTPPQPSYFLLDIDLFHELLDKLTCFRPGCSQPIIYWHPERSGEACLTYTFRCRVVSEWIRSRVIEILVSKFFNIKPQTYSRAEPVPIYGSDHVTFE